MTPEQIEELLSRMKRNQNTIELVNLRDGTACYAETARLFLATVAEHADITLKPKPDPCREAFDKLPRQGIYVCVQGIEIHMDGAWYLWEACWKAAKEQSP